MYDATWPSDNRELRAEDEEQDTRWIFAFNAPFASMNATKVFMKDNGMDNSMAKVKSLMFNANYTKLIFDMSRCRPNRTLISKIVKELIGWQPKAA